MTSLREGAGVGWQPAETRFLAVQLGEAAQTGRPLSVVFEAVARQTGRKANSVRNYYYTVLRNQMTREQRGLIRREQGSYVPFTPREIRWLLREVLTGEAAGESIRAIAHRMGKGNRTLALRYQNKYRSILRTHPDMVRSMVDELRREGRPCVDPYAEKEGTVEKPEDADLSRLLPEGMERLRQSGQADIQAMVQGMRGLLSLAVAGEVANHRLETVNAQLRETTAAWEAQKKQLRHIAAELRGDIESGALDMKRALEVLEMLECL